ncbi:hypothetical protein [Cupriavidus sp. RAF12]|uniref:hypothetical protein n=1 Tax=Cupriavidus sp. RAF12 TaxID=3233050 RepID=UPI003F920B22
MGTATLIGIDLGKHCFFLHAQDRRGHEVWRKKLTRARLLALLANCPAAGRPGQHGQVVFEAAPQASIFRPA